MVFAQQQNHITTNFSEHICVIKQCMTAYLDYRVMRDLMMQNVKEKEKTSVSSSVAIQIYFYLKINDLHVEIQRNHIFSIIAKIH